MKVEATLTLTVVYDDGGCDFDADATLQYLVTYAAGNGLLVPESGPATVESYDVKIAVRDLPGAK